MENSIICTAVIVPVTDSYRNTVNTSQRETKQSNFFIIVKMIMKGPTCSCLGLLCSCPLWKESRTIWGAVVLTYAYLEFLVNISPSKNTARWSWVSAQFLGKEATVFKFWFIVDVCCIFYGKKTQIKHLKMFCFVFYGGVDKKKRCLFSGCCCFWTVSFSVFWVFACNYDPVLLPSEFMAAFPLTAVVWSYIWFWTF